MSHPAFRIRKRRGRWHAYRRNATPAPLTEPAFHLLRTVDSWEDAMTTVAEALAAAALNTPPGQTPPVLAACLGCGRMTSPAPNAAHRPPGVIQRVAHGLCSTCYAKNRRRASGTPQRRTRDLPAPCAGGCGRIVADRRTRSGAQAPEGFAQHRGRGMCAACYQRHTPTPPATPTTDTATAPPAAPSRTTRPAHKSTPGERTPRRTVPRSEPAPPKLDKRDGMGPALLRMAPTPPDVLAAAARTVARHATSPQDHTQLRAMLGLDETALQAAS